ncbi:FAD-dependent oxidoreductase [Phytohabitans suffuscus]|uniref:Pentachlorophenol monooxygenase n=1 Tax=Phytohabitans suffuscus TaxID=624315 RepID=A0A6F8YYC7_9ACTN|nr:FAD-dependent oxidoreductase [Phytohabitans suffuscus]BCB91003.1 pentachlorophenol monooxygenase [Phytohabitans suffuscus]
MTGVRERDVIVVGAGPVGLTAALALAQEGLRVAVLEKLDEPSTEWRASTFHPPTLEIGLDLGVAGEMLRQGLIAPRYQIRDRRAGVVAEFDFSALSGETPYPFRLQLEQYKYVQIIERRLRDLHPDCPVRYGQEVTAVANRDGGAELTVHDGSRWRAGWVVAADGARSVTRRELGIPFEGLTYEHRYLVLSIDHPMDQLLPGICEVNYVADPDEHLLLLRIPDLWRVVLSVPAEIGSDEATSPAYVRKRLALLIGDGTDLPVRESTVYAVHQRVADRFRDGRVLLVGDAAHINSPMGGMGLNSGIHDAYDLATHLTGTVRGKEPDSAVDDWAARRRQVAVEEIYRLTHQTTTAMAESDENERLAFQRRMAGIAADPALAKEWMLEASMISNVRRHGLPERAAARTVLGRAGGR